MALVHVPKPAPRPPRFVRYEDGWAVWHPTYAPDEGGFCLIHRRDGSTRQVFLTSVIGEADGGVLYNFDMVAPPSEADFDLGAYDG